MTAPAPSLWRNRSFMLLLSGETASTFLAAFLHVALPAIAVTTLVASEFQVGLLGASESAAFLFLTLPAGAWVDRLSRRRVMITANLVRAALVALIPLAWVFNILSIPWLLWIVFGLGVCRVFFDVAYMSILPTLVTKATLTDANSRLQATFEVANATGPSIAGPLVAAFSAPVAPLMSVGGFLASAFTSWRIREPVVTRTVAQRDLGGEIREGLDFVRHHPLISRVVYSAMLSNLFGGLTFTMFPVLVLRQFGFGPTGLGLLMTISSLGALAGALAGPVFVKRLGDGHAIPMTALYEAVAGFGVPASLLVPHAFAFATLAVSGFLMMFGIVAFNIAQVSLRQRVCPERLLGRMNATVRFAVWGVNPFASLLSGTIAMLIGLQGLFWIGATGSMLAILILVFSPLWHLKKVDSYEEGVAAEGLAELPPPVL